MAASAVRISLLKFSSFYKLDRGFNHICVNLNKHDVSRRCYARAFRRNPIQILVPGEEGNQEENKSYSFKKSEVEYIKPKPKPQPLNNFKKDLQNDESFDGEDNSAKLIPHYIKLGDNDSKFTQAISLVKSRHKREETGKIILEGKRLIKDALESGLEVDAVYFSMEENVSGLPLENIINLKLYKVMYKHLQLWSDLTTSPGVMGIFKMPNYEKLNLSNSQLPLTIILDEIREPNNLGAILRCAAASGCSKLLLTKGCVDVWEPKVLRSAAGAHFHVRIQNNIEWSFMNNYTSADANVILADNYIIPEEKKDNLILQPLNEKTFQEENWSEVSEDGKFHKPSYDDRKRLKKFRNYTFPTVLYHQIKIDPTKETVLVIGGESKGLSDACRQFAATRKANQLTIELENNVESLNSSVAAGIIIFEIIRQIKYVNT